MHPGGWQRRVSLAFITGVSQTGMFLFTSYPYLFSLISPVVATCIHLFLSFLHGHDHSRTVPLCATFFGSWHQQSRVSKGERRKRYDMVHCVGIVIAASVIVQTYATELTSNFSTIVPSGALQQGAPQSLKVQQICAYIEVYQQWRIEECRGMSKRVAAQVCRTAEQDPPLTRNTGH